MSTGAINPLPNASTTPPLAVPRPEPDWDAMRPYLPLVRQIASRIRRRLPSSVEVDDLAQAGTIGLMSALASASNAGRECSESYVRLRVQGAILDSLREYDWASRYMRDRNRKLQTAQNELRQTLGHEPTSEEVASHLDLNLETYFEFAAFSQSPTIIDRGTNRDGEEITMEEFVEDEAEPRPDQIYENHELRRLMLANAATLGAESCCVLLLYYFAEWTGAQIAEALQLSEARVSQLRSAALATLRKRSRSTMEGRVMPPRKSSAAQTMRYHSERDNPSSLLRALMGVMALCEPERWEHCRRVEAYVRHFAGQAGVYPSRDLPRLFDAALLHDLGTICVPAPVLDKPSRLDHDEWRSVRRHVEVGCSILERIEALRPLGPIVRHHHELYRGGGYPEGIAGDQIPLGSRLLTFADTLDALTTARPYRPAVGFDAALRTMKSLIGLQFDPELAKIFFRIPASEWRAIREYTHDQPENARLT
jgi:FliA/WhiG family RNA polymerase sigma factor